MHLWDTKTNGSVLLNLRPMNDAERNARPANLERKITGTNSEILTGPIRGNPLKHVMGREQCRTMTQYSYSCIKPQQTWSTLFILQVHLFSCNLSCHWCLGHSMANPHSQVHPGRMYISSGLGPLWSPNSCHFKSYQSNAFEMTPC